MRFPAAIALVGVLLPLLAGCSDDLGASLSMRSAAPIPEKMLALMSEKGMAKDAPIMIRSFKKESELEIWKMTRRGDYALLKTYPICRWSGQLGPKTREGDRQAPEGFYAITPASLNPNSRLYLSFDMNYPNSYDRAYGRTGSNLMVHGACSSAGCYSMSDEQMMEIYALLRDSFAGGQGVVQMQALPFRMNAENFARHRLDPNMAFWRNLKEGVDRFDVAMRPPAVGVCGKRYVFDAKPKDPSARMDPLAACPAFEGDDAMAVALGEKTKKDEASITSLVAAGTPAVKLVYQDGAQHQSFREALSTGSVPATRLFGASAREYQAISRPDALRAGPQEIVMDPAPAAKAAKAVAAAPANAPIAAAPAKTTAIAAPAKPAVAAVPAKTGVAALARPAVAAAGPLAPPAPAPAAAPSLYQRMIAFTGLGAARP